MSYVLAFLGFAALIILHEGGHFVAAKAVGMRVERFSLFFGPLVAKRRVGETEYGIGVIPLGGYVKITGMTPGETFPTPEVEARAYFNQPVWKRIVVIVAGPLVNLIIAFVIVWAVFLSNGQYLGTPTGARVASVVAGSPASHVLKRGDEILAVDGRTASQGNLARAIGADRCPGAQRAGCRAAAPVSLKVGRDGTVRTVSLRPVYEAKAKRPEVGIEYEPTFRYTHVAVSFAGAVSLGASDLGRVTGATLSAIGRIFESKERKQLHSVVGIYKYTQESINTSATMALDLIALISLSLAIINMFPFLPLDGGHVFWALAEKLRGRRIPFAVMERAGFVGFALIVMLFAIGLTNDVTALTGRGLNLP